LIVDTSALVAILKAEPDADLFIRAFQFVSIGRLAPRKLIQTHGVPRARPPGLRREASGVGEELDIKLLCGACYEVCPVKINIPEVLIHLRHKVVEKNGWYAPESLAMKAVAQIFRSERRFRAAQRLGRIAESPLVRRDAKALPIFGQKHEEPAGWIGWLPGLLGGWTSTRDLQAMPQETFREWWEKRGKH